MTFSGRYAMARGQTVVYVTDRAVFRLTSAGIELVELAPGIDLAHDVLKQIEFPITVACDLRPMDRRLFGPEPMGLAREFRASATARTRRR